MPRGIIQDQVNQAADTIVAAGEKSTVERIRSHLGTGSPNTVTRMLDAWRQGLAERLRQASLLPDLPDEVGQAMTALWAQALQHARTQVQQELQAERETLQRALQLDGVGPNVGTLRDTFIKATRNVAGSIR